MLKVFVPIAEQKDYQLVQSAWFLCIGMDTGARLFALRAGKADFLNAQDVVRIWRGLNQNEQIKIIKLAHFHISCNYLNPTIYDWR